MSQEEELIALKEELIEVFSEKWKECGEIYDDMTGLFTSPMDTPLSIKATCEISTGDYVLASYTIKDGNKSPLNIEHIHEFFDLFKEHEEFPDNIAERGVPDNTCFSYISTTFLNGYIGYVDIIKSYIVNRRKETWTSDNINLWHDKLSEGGHSNTSTIFDDVIVLAKTENCYWFFWADRDCSDSCIGRFDKENYTDEQVLELLKKHMKTEFDEYEEINLSGWPTL